jgi:hypothetical protein
MLQLGKTGLLLVVLIVLAMFGCGGSSPNEPSNVFISPPDTVTQTPYVVTTTPDAAGNSVHLAGSLNYGDVLLLSATVFGTKGTNVTNATVAWSSGNTSLLTPSTTLPSGYACVTGFQGCTLLCAGTWDSANIDCIPPASGTAGGPITVTAQSGAATGTVTVYVHPKVDKLVVNSAPGGCVSLGGRTQLSATAYSGGTVLPSSGPGDIIGPIFWQIANANVATFTATNPNGVLTTVAPGGTTIVASIRPGLPVNGSTPAPSISSPPTSFLTCPISSIHVYVSGGAATSTTIAPTGTSQLAADVFDSNGTLITSAPIRFFSSQPGAATVSTTGGLVTGVAAGTSSVTAACSGTGCNIGLPPIYSNVVTASVTGSTSTTVYAAANGSTSLTPISGGSLGTAITLPNAANSILFNRAGTKAYIGSASGVMIFDPVANTVSVLPGTPIGQVIGISPNGNLLVTFNSSGNVVQILDVSSATSTITDSSFSVGAVPRVDFSPDSEKAFITAGTTLYSFTSATSPLVPVALSAVANDVSFLPQGSFAYLAGGAASAITVRTTCDNSQADSKTVPGTPQLISTLPDGTRVVAADPPGVDVIALSTTNVGCPPPLVDSAPTSTSFGLGTFTSQQLLVLPNSSKAYVVSNLPQLLVYDLVANTASTVSLANAASPLNAGYTLDSSTLYVGGSDNALHVINTSTGADSAPISLSFTPNLLAVRP